MSTVNNNRGRSNLVNVPRTPGATTNTPASTTTPATRPGRVDPATAGRVPTTDAATAGTLPTGSGGRAGANSPLNVRSGANEVVGADGTLLPGVTGEDRQARLIDLAMPAEPGATKPGPFDGVTQPRLLEKVAQGLAREFAAVTGQPPDDATALAWRQVRASCLHLLQAATLRAAALGGETAGLLRQTIEVIKQEPHRGLRDFAFETLLQHAEAKRLPEVKEARELLYPSSMPFAEWPKRVKVVRYCDDDGSKIEDNIWFFKEMMNAKHTANPDGSHTFLIARRGAKHEIEVTIPPKSAGLNIVEHVGNKDVHVIEYCGHAGHGNFFESVLASGTKGTGAGQVMAGYQCWGEGNTETLERQCPDLQYMSTTEMTSDNYDFIMQQHLFEAILDEKPWSAVMKGAIKDLKRDYPEDIQKGELKVDTHYMDPTNRARLLTHYDRDSDGVRDGEDHVFNVIYPKRVDTTGGYDPVVQAVPRFALDGTELSKSVNALSLVIRYDHLLTPAQEAKVGWVPEKWQPGGFFEPDAGDLRAFRFTRSDDGGVRIALSTRFAHTKREDLQRLLAVETGLWVGKEAGLDDTRTGALAVTMLQRIVDGQGEWFSKEDGLLDEYWAEEQMLFSRYGLGGFSVADISNALKLGDHGDFKPEHFEHAVKFIKEKSPNIGALVTRAPTRVGDAVDVPPAGVSLMDGNNRVDMDKLGPALKGLGITGELVSSDPSYLSSPPTATNVLVTMEEAGKKQLVGVAIDAEGNIRNVARLAFDFSKKLEGAVGATLARIATSGGLGVSDAQGAYQAARAANPDPLQAMVAAARALRAMASPAAQTDTMDALSSLVQSGVATADKVSEASQALMKLFPQAYQVRGEAALFSALAAAPEMKTKLPAITRKYNEIILAGDGSEDAWKKAAASLAEAIPTKLTVPAETDRGALLRCMGQEEVLKAARPRLIAAMGIKPDDLAVLAMKSGLQPTVDTAAAEKEARAVFKKTGDIALATLAGLDVLRQAGSVSLWTISGTVNLEELGALTDAAEAERVTALVTAASKRMRVEEAVVELVGAGDPARDKKDVANKFRTAFARTPDVVQALTAAMGTLPKAAAPEVLGKLEDVLQYVDDALKPAAINAVLAALGMDRADGVLAEKRMHIKGSFEGNDSGAAALRAYETAFKAATRAGKNLPEALAAGARAVVPFVVGAGMNYGFSTMVSSSALLSTDETAALQTALAPVMQAESVARALLRTMDAAGGATDRFKKDLAAAAGEADPMASLLAFAKRARRPAGATAGDGTPDLSSVVAITDKTQRTELAQQIFRLGGFTPEGVLKAELRGSFRWAFSPPDSAEATAAHAAAEACFKPGVSLADATVAAVEVLVRASKETASVDVSDLAAAGMLGDLDLAAFNTRLEAALKVPT